MDRRTFVGASAAAFAGIGVARPGAARVSTNGSERAARALRVLILGGTGFIGPHQVRYALARGHGVTLFNRGRTNTHLFPDVEKLVGDRDGDLDALRGRTWDVVLDNSGFEPRVVRDSAELLAGSVGQYLFVSTQSVYADRSIIDQDESGAVGRPGVPEEEWSGYGPLKALCEHEVRRAFPGRHTVVRPPVIVGPGDGSDRFTYWVDRVDRGGEVLAPGSPDDPTQFIDVRDVTHFMVRCVENATTGTFNACGPATPLRMAELLYGIRAVTTSSPRFTWVDADFLSAQGVRGFSDLPLWYPAVGRTAGFFRMSAAKAQAHGLTYRPLAVTAADTLEWWRSLPDERRADPRAGIVPAREQEVLRAWNTHRGRRT